MMLGRLIRLVAILGCAWPVSAAGQVAVEVPRPTVSEEYATLMQELDQLGPGRATEALALWRAAEERIRAPEERFDVVFWELAHRSAGDGDFQGALDVLRSGQAEGLFFPWDDRPYPRFQPQLEGLPGYADFVRENKNLRDQAQAVTTAQYVVQLPEHYSPTRRYPTLFVLLGASGSIRDILEYWTSPTLTTDFVVVFVQGAVRTGTNRYSYLHNDHRNILTAYEQVLRDYAVDPTRVVFAGQSAGGNRSLTMALHGLVPAAGLLLAFPALSMTHTEAGLRAAAERGMRLVTISGEEDPGVHRQRALAETLDSIGLPNRLFVAPDTGHWFPDDFSQRIDEALAFLLRPGTSPSSR